MKVEFDHFSDMQRSGLHVQGIRFVRDGGSGTQAAFDLWDGYFDPIMQALFDLCFTRKATAYLPLLQEWNEVAGFEKTGRGPVRALAETLEALRKIEPAKLREFPSAPGEVGQVLLDLISFLDSAAAAGQTVTISKEL